MLRSVLILVMVCGMHTPTRPRPRPLPLLALLGAAALPLAACAAPDAQDAATDAATTAAAPTEEAANKPRLVITYDGGLQVLDATTLEVVSDIPLAGFNRVNPAGDERHALVSTTGGFQVLDLGVWGEPHGDHAHYYSSDPALLDVTYPAEVPGHVVPHHGLTVLFDDGTGEVDVVDSGAIAEGDVLNRYTTPAAHHGVAVQLSDGSLFVTDGTEDERRSVRVLDSDGEVITGSDDCPGVHGETVAEHEAVVVGCEDGALFYHKGEIVKLSSPDGFGRIGNLRGVEDSDLVLGDYSTNPEGGDLTQVAIIDIHDETLDVVDLGVEYTFRSLARDDEGNGLVLADDGRLHVLDLEEGTVTRSIEVIDAWDVPEEWQLPRPTLVMLDGSAYVTDPATQRILAVDVETGEVWAEGSLDVAPNEIVGVTGDVVDGVSDDHEDDGDDH